ncbi:MAG TPA: DUF2298 domain-containing protein [Ktedonosporobacter sp.]|nr:DUF2298 domain-containing protein [Ktedonosporobacter sp.]
MYWRPLAFYGLLLPGLFLRLYNLNWDQGNSFHPDERQILFHVTTLGWPTSFAQFLDPAHSPLNPHFFAYGSFPLYLLAFVGHFVVPTSAPDAFVRYTLVGRVLSALFDSGTILLTGWLALLLVKDETPGRRNAWNAALLAAALVTFTPLQLQLSHFYAVDTILLFFVMLTLLASVALVRTNRLMLWSFIAGLGYGLALATKFSAAPLAVPLFVSALLSWYYRRDFFPAASSLLLSLVVTVMVFLIAQPYAYLDAPNYIQQVAEQGSLVRGTLDLPYVRQFAGTIPFIYQAQNMLLWGMGVTLGLAAFAGLLWLCWQVWRRRAGSWLIVLSWVLVYGTINCLFYVKYMRYMLPIYPLLALMAAAVLLEWGRYLQGRELKKSARWERILPSAYIIVVGLVVAGTMFQGLALMNVYSQPNTRIQASRWIYSHLKPGSVLTYEQWDDPLPVAVDGHDPSMFVQASYPDANGQPTTGLDLYGDDTTAKARQLANFLPTVNAITMATDRLDKSIPRLPQRYPLTIHYYQLLYSGQLGFRLVATFQNHPNLFGITLDDSNADESYSVFDHPTTRIFERDTPYPYTPDQLFQKLLDGVQLPAPGARLSGAQHTLMLTPQQIEDNQQSPPFAVQFPSGSPANQAPILFWWLAITLLGLLTCPLIFSVFRMLSDRGYLFSKMLGLLLVAYLSWLLAAMHWLPFSHLSLLLVVGGLLLCSTVMFFFQRAAIVAFCSQHWRRLLLSELLFSLAYLLFVGIRSLNPDLWQIYLGGEKPMELAFLNAILRSPYAPPFDPWFAGGYINYYYYGYYVIGSLIKLTGIIPTTAFNLAIPTLFALTFGGAVIVVYSLANSVPVALLGGYFTAFIGNFNGLAQLNGQALAFLSHTPLPAFDYWQSSRIIPFTINEFPFWTFLFADLHPHVIDLPISVLMLGIIAALLLARDKKSLLFPASYERLSLYLLAAFVFGTIACVNPWDMPVHATLLAGGLVVQRVMQKRQESRMELLIALGFRLVTTAALCGLGYLFYLPFYLSYQQLYINGIGLVVQGTNLGDYFMVFGLWIFLALSFFLAELYRGWAALRNLGGMFASWHVAGYMVVSAIIVCFLAFSGVKLLLAALLVLGILLLLRQLRARLAILRGAEGGSTGIIKMVYRGGGVIDQTQAYTYLLLLVGLCIALGIEVVYVRDFLDGSGFARMNTVFKFSMQLWLLMAIGGALVVQRLWRVLGGVIRRAWMTALVMLLLVCSIFLVEGMPARIHDHQVWIDVQKPAVSAAYTPTLDGFAFVRAWYPGDAAAITWLNTHVAGAPVILEAAAPVSYQWYNRVSVFTGLPDVIGWADHEGEQRYSDQPINRITDVGIIYSTTDTAQALELLHFYQVRYIYVGQLERDLYGTREPERFDKFEHMVGSALQVAYRSSSVTIYEVVV